MGMTPNSLLRNNGDTTFTDVTKEAGLYTERPSQTACWGDFNNDGLLDLFVGNESIKAGQMTYSGSAAQKDMNFPSELYQNNGDGTFSKVGKEKGIVVNGFIKGSAWGDVNNDGNLDLFVTNIMGSNLLFVNEGENSAWRFTEQARERGVADHQFSFTTWFWDYDNDGWQDLFVGSYSLNGSESVGDNAVREYLGQPTTVQKPVVYRNVAGQFEDVTRDLGLDRPLFIMGSNFGDLDNDGFLDCYLGTGDPDYRSIVPNRMFLNREGSGFLDVTTSGGFGHIQKGHGVAFGDVDNDGDQDISVVMGGAYEGDRFQNLLFQNPGSGNNWITLILEGVNANRAAIGTRVKLTVSDGESKRVIHATVSTGGSFGSSTCRLEVGLGSATQIKEVMIDWQGGQAEAIGPIEVNQILKIKEGSGTPAPL
jgi:hypothetical protein